MGRSALTERCELVYYHPFLENDNQGLGESFLELELSSSRRCD